jgi:hypothetical protein
MVPAEQPEGQYYCESLQVKLDAALHDLQESMQGLYRGSESRAKLYLFVRSEERRIRADLRQEREAAAILNSDPCSVQDKLSIRTRQSLLNLLEKMKEMIKADQCKKKKGLLPPWVKFLSNLIEKLEHRLRFDEGVSEKEIATAIEERILPLITGISIYRENPVRKLAEIDESYAAFEREASFGIRDKDKAERFWAALNNATLLDIALLQEATRWQVRQSAALDKGKEVAQMVFGDSSCLERLLDEYARRSQFEHLKPYYYFADGIAICIAYMIYHFRPIIIAYLTTTDPEFRAILWEAISSVALIMGIVIGIASLSYTAIVAQSYTPREHTRKYLSTRYQNIQVPEKVKKIADLAYEIQEKKAQIESMEDGEEKAQCMQAVIDLIKELLEQIKIYNQLITKRYVDYQPHETPECPQPLDSLDPQAGLNHSESGDPADPLALSDTKAAVDITIGKELLAANGQQGAEADAEAQAEAEAEEAEAVAAEVLRN